MNAKGVLSTRGNELASVSGVVDQFKELLENPYDPDTNPDGIVNIGTAENKPRTSIDWVAYRVGCEYVSFGDADQFEIDGVRKYEDAIIDATKAGKRIRALILCHPHNPLGRCYAPNALIDFMKLCSKYRIHLIVDEIYALSVYDVPDPKAIRFSSILSFNTDEYISPDYIHLLYGMSKDTAAGGIRLGCLYTRCKKLMQALQTITMFHWSGNPNEKIATLMLEDEKWMDNFLHLSRSLLAERNKMVRKMLDVHGIQYYPGANAGFFIWIDLRPWIHLPFGEVNLWAGEDDLTMRLIENKVFITNGKAMSAEEPGWYRLIFSQDERIVKEGIKRIVQVIKGKVDGGSSDA
ncbi:MAG: hypothetical protein Q9217_004911 [Psora testacea]